MIDNREQLDSVLEGMRGRIIAYGDRKCCGYGEDLYQETWVKCLKLRLGCPEKHPSPELLVWKIVNNLLINQFRQQRVRSSYLKRQLRHGPSPSPSLEESLSTVEIYRLVQSALKTVPDFDRQLLEDRYIRGMPAVEIARRRGVRPSAVRLQLHRARLKLRGVVQCRRTINREE